MIPWLSIVVAAVKLFTALITWLRERQLISSGKSEAVAEAMAAAAKEAAAARQVDNEAISIHVKNKTNDAFDREFERKDT